MNCAEARRLIHGYVDGELELAMSLEMEGHLADCGSCLRMCNSQKDLQESVRAASLRFDEPKGLEKRIRRAVAREHKQAAVRTGRSWRSVFGPARPALAAATVALAALVAWNLGRSSTASDMQDTLVEEVVSDHVRSLMANHLFDVASTDQHTVKPWFTGKIDFSPQVVDLAAQGFPLMGGRLDYLAGRPVAALVYGRRKHVINLYMWPLVPGERLDTAQSYTRRGFHILHWTARGMTYVAVSDVNAGDLKDFSRRIGASAAAAYEPR